ncbi:MAG: tail fiber protein [Actinobacteria bacterium]|nr:tail fiber protein [Actinomycetota bacterium]MCB8996657.1 tail fiber protein [Actinomycetota bacterium]
MDSFLGQVLLLPYDFPAQGVMYCEGQVLAIRDHVSLFSLLGARFGGDGVTTFALPDLTGKEPADGLRYCIVMHGSYPARP